MIYLDLFTGFLKVGLFAFGGAYAAIPLIREIVLSHGWLSDEMLTYMIAVSESTPGPIMVNLATYVGSSQAGAAGALLATAAVVLPSFLIILLIAAIMKTAIRNPYVQAVLRGMKPCMAGIIFATGIYMIFRNCFCFSGVFQPDFRRSILTVAILIFLCVSRLILKKPVSPIQLILFSALTGLLFL